MGARKISLFFIFGCALVSPVSSRADQRQIDCREGARSLTTLAKQLYFEAKRYEYIYDLDYDKYRRPRMSVEADSLQANGIAVVAKMNRALQRLSRASEEQVDSLTVDVFGSYRNLLEVVNSLKGAKTLKGSKLWREMQREMSTLCSNLTNDMSDSHDSLEWKVKEHGSRIDR